MHPYGEKKPGGLPRIIFGWASALMSIDKANDYLIFFKDKTTTPPDLPGSRWSTHMLGTGRFWLNRLRRFPEADVYLFNTPVLPLFWKPKKAVIIALDYPYKYLKAESFKQWLFRFFIGWYHGYSLRRADHIISVSDSTKRDTIKFFGVPEEKITTVYHGFTDVCAVVESKVKLPEKYFFFAGTIKERKNVHRIIEGFRHFLTKYPQAPHMVVIGGINQGRYYERVLALIETLELQDRVLFLGHLNESQMSYVYKRAEALVFPSIVEGTGFPILEAMSCGVPAITSNIFGPAELGSGGAGILINPYNSEEIGEAMGQVAFDAEFRKQHVMRGLEQVHKFNWENTGRETLAILERIVRA